MVKTEVIAHRAQPEDLSFLLQQAQVLRIPRATLARRLFSDAISKARADPTYLRRVADAYS